MSAALAMGVMDYSSVLSKMVLFTMSRAWQLGRAVQRANIMHSSITQSIVEEQEGMVLIIGKVSNKISPRTSCVLGWGHSSDSSSTYVLFLEGCWCGQGEWCRVHKGHLHH